MNSIKCFIKQKHNCMLYISIFLGLILTSNVSATEWDLQLYKKKTSAELMDISWKSSSTKEKLFLRSYLSKKYPNTPEGHLAKAWMASYDKNPELAKKLYLECLEKYPTYKYCIANGAGQTKEKLNTIETYLRSNLSYLSTIVSNYLYYYMEENKNATVESTLEAAIDIMGDNPEIHSWAGEKYIKLNKIDLAEKSFDKALSFDNSEFKHFKAAAEFRSTYLVAETNTSGKAKEVVNTMAIFLNERNPDIYQQAYAKAYIGDAIFKITKEIAYSIDFWRDSWNLHPTYEVAFHLVKPEIFQSYRNKMQKMYDDLSSLTKSIPMLSYVLSEVYFLDNEIAKAKKVLQAAYDNNFGAQDAYSILEDLVVTNQSYISNFDWVDSLLKSYQKSFPFREDIQNLFYKNNLYAGRFSDAMDSLRLYEDSIPNANQAYFQPKYDSLNEYVAKITEKEKFYQENPFLKYWDEKFGNSISIQIEFAVNSSTINAQYFSTLDKMAEVLKRQDSENYLFQLDGHTDSQGAADLNQRLSFQRAQAIKDYFVKKHNIESARLAVKGYGEVFPVETNNTEEGRRQNRRVELKPMGRVDKIELFPPTKLSPKDAINLSPDGYTLAVSYSPIELWDLRSQTKIRDLGRGSYINSFSPSGRYLIAASDWKDDGGDSTFSVILYDVKTGLVVDRIISASTIIDFAWSANSNKVSFVTKWGYLYLYSLDSKKIIKQTVLSANAKRPTGIQWDHNSNRIYTSERDEDYIRVWDGNSLKHLDDWHGVSWVLGMKLSADHKYLLAHDNRRVLSIFNTLTGDKENIITQEWGGGVYPHPTKPWVLIANRQKPFNVSIYNYETLEKISNWSENAYRDFEFSNDGELLYQANNDHLLVRNGLSFDAKDEIRQDVSQSTSLTLFDNQNKFLLGTNSSTQVWDLESAKRIHEWDIPLKLFTANDINYGLNTEKSQLYLVDLEKFSLEKTIVLPNRPDVKDHDENWLVSAEDGYLGSDSNSYDTRSKLMGDISLIDLNDKNVLNKTQVEFVTDTTRYSDIYRAGFSTIDVDKSLGLIAYSTYWQDGYGMSQTKSKQVTVLDALTMKVKYVIKRKSEIQEVRFNKGKLEIFEGVNPLIFNPINGEYIEKNRDDNRHLKTLATVDGNIITTNSETWVSIGNKGKILFPDNLQSAVVSKNKKLLIALLKDGKIELYRLSDQKKLLTLLSRAKNEWLAYTPTGYYQSSLLGAKGSTWSFGDLTLPFETFADKFYNPRIIEQQLAAAASGNDAVLNQLSTLDINPEVLTLPYKIRLDEGQLKQTSTNTIKVPVLMVKVGKTEMPATLEWTVNGQQIGGGRGLGRTTNKIIACPSDAIMCEPYEIEVPLDQGKNIIEFKARFNGANIDSQTLIISRNIQKTELASASTYKPTNNLWFFGIGVSDYKNTEYNLKFAHADATALEKTFKSQEGKLYKQVNTKLILNDEATEKNIKVELNRFLRQASSLDTIILFTAGHGTLDSDGSVYFMTHESNLEEPYTGLNVSFFKDFLHTRPINQKALFWMDICHAGAIGGEWGKTRGRASADDAIRMLSEGTGVAVMASSTGMQSSLEGPMYGNHGAFTSALLKALNGKADSETGDNDGLVSVLELQTYVSSEVPKMTGGRQHPTSPSQIRLRDFPVVLK